MQGLSGMGLLNLVLLMCLVCYAAVSAQTGSCTDSKRRCMKRAKCDAITGACVCRRGRAGDGEMECFKQNTQRLCTMDSNSRVKTWDGGAKTTISLPCWFRAVYLRVPIRPFAKKRFLGLNVLAYNTLTEHGEFYVDRVLIVVELLRFNPATNSFRVVGRRRFFITADQIWKAKTNPWVYGRQLTWRGLTFRFQWDKRDKFAVFLPPVKGARIKFRAYHPNRRREKRTPGLSILVPKKHVQIVKDPPWQGLCGTPGLGHIYNTTAADWRLESSSMAALFFALGQKRTGWRDSLRCRQAKRLMKRCRYKKLAILTCSFLLNNKDVVKCLQKAKEDPMEHFVYCLRWICRGRKGKCRLVRNVIDQNDCKSSRLFREIGCSRWRRRQAIRRIGDQANQPKPQ